MGATAAVPFRTLATRASGSFIVFVHGSLAPSAAEWNQVLDIYRRAPNMAALRTLVYTDGGAPNAAQRADLSSMMSKANLQLAVMTSSTIGRAAGTALGWLIPGLRVFDATDFDGAFDHLHATGGDRRTLRDLVEELRRELTQRAEDAGARRGV